MTTHHQRAQAIRNMRRYLDRLEQADQVLAQARRRPVKPPNAPDGWPRGGGDGSSHASGHSDPTGNAVEAWIDTERTRVADLVDRCWARLCEAEGILAGADSDRARALEPERPRSAAAPESAVHQTWWCISCARPWPGTQQAIAFEPRHRLAKRSRDDLCNACLNSWEASGDDATSREFPDVRIVIWRHEHPGRYVTEAVRRSALAESLDRVRQRAPKRQERSA